jgi:hypothetical protein
MEPLFTGYLWGLSWDSKYATITAVDELTKIAQVELAASTLTGSGDTGIQRIQRILTQANSTSNLRRRTSITGRAMAATTLAGNALAQIKAAVTSEWGLLTVGPDGTLLYGPEWWTKARGSDLGNLNQWPETFTNATSPGLSYASVRNYVEGSSTSGALTPVEAADQSSIDLYGLNRWTFDTTLRDQANLTWWTGVALNLYKANPAGWPQTIGINGSYDNGTNPYGDVYGTINYGSRETIGLAWTVTVADLDASIQVCGRTDNYTPETGWETIFSTFANPYTYTTDYFTLNSDPLDRLDYSAVLK